MLEDLFQLLKAINKQPITNQRELASTVHLSVGKVNTLLKEAEQQGFLCLSKSGKRSRFLITEKGEALLESTLLTQRATKLTLPSDGTGTVKTAVLLAAGRRENFDCPVSMLPLNDMVLIDRNLTVLESCGIEQFILVAGYQAERLKEHFSGRHNVTVLANPRYKWSGTMYGLSLAKELLDEDFLVLKSDVVFEQRAITELLKEQNPFSTVLAAPSGHSDEAFVELDNEGNIFRISKDIHQINKVQGELTGIAKVSLEAFEKMLEYFDGNQNPFLNFEYVLENIGRIYRFTGVMVDDLVWSKVETREQYQNVVNIVYPRILRKETEMKEKFAADTIMEILQVPREAITEISFAGGLTNKNYYVALGEKAYILRLPGIMTQSMISRENEKRNAQIASDMGMNCKLVYCNAETGVKLSEYIDSAETLNGRTVRLEENIKLVARILRELHTSDFHMENEFNPFQETCKYERLFDTPCEESMYEGYQTLRPDVFALQQRLRELGWEQKPCHNDLLANNLVKNSATGRLYLIDWEYSGINDPMFDVAALFLENGFTPEDQELFFHYYFGEESQNLTPYLEKILIFEIVQDFLWSVWTVLKESKGDDYGSYGQDRFHRAVKNMQLWKDTYGNQKGV